MGVATVTVNGRDVDPHVMVVTTGAAEQIGGPVPLAVGDTVHTPHGDRIVIAIEDGTDPGAWAADGDGEPWSLSVRARASDRLLAPAPTPSADDRYHPVHHTPITGVPVRDAHLDWLEARGVWHVREEIAWRQEHRERVVHALGRRAVGERLPAAWSAVDPERGLGPIREGLIAQARVLGFELQVEADGVRIGLLPREDPETWSSGPPTTSAAFRGGDPAPGGVHDPALVGTVTEPRFSHLPLPFAVLPRHLEPWVAGLLDREIAGVRAWARADGAEALRGPLDEALEQRVPRPTTLGGTPLTASDFLWTELPLLPAAYRRGRRDGERRSPHGVDGTLHALVAEVRKVAKLGGLEAVSKALRPVLRGRVCDVVDQHLGWPPEDLAEDHRSEGWGWSIALDLRETLSIDGVMLDGGGQALAVIEPQRQRVGLPARLRALLLQPDEPEEIVLLSLPEGVCVVRPEPVEGPAIRLPPDIADALDVSSGQPVWVLPMITAEAQAELRAVGDRLRLCSPPRIPGWLDQVASAPADSLLLQLANLARVHAVDLCAGAVGRRVFGGVVAPPVGTPGDEVRQVHRGLHALGRVLERHEPQTVPSRGASAGRLRDLPGLRAEVGALFTAHDGQQDGGEPLWVVGERRYRFPSLRAEGDPPRPVVGEGDAGTLTVRDDGRVVDQDDRVVAGSLAALIHGALLARLQGG